MKTIHEKQLKEQKETNIILWVNTIFTIAAGIGSIWLPLMEWIWHHSK